MRILAVETSGPIGSIALADGDRLAEEVRLSAGPRRGPCREDRFRGPCREDRLRGRDLVAAVRDVCRDAGWTPGSIQLVAVSIGPGSFTGLRIAVVFAKFLAWRTGAKIVAVPTLRALAESAPSSASRIVPILDAKRGGLFAAIYHRQNDDLAEILPPTLIEPEDLADRLQAPAFILGHGIPKAREALGEFDLAPEDLWDVRPAIVARLGLAMHARGQHTDPLRLAPLYIRRPEAEELWQRRKR